MKYYGFNMILTSLPALMSFEGFERIKLSEKQWSEV